MAEILYHFIDQLHILPEDTSIHWLTMQDYSVFTHHLELCGQRPISEEIWKEIFEEGTRYCGLFIDGEMIARACVEVISPEQWEVSDVRVVREYRNQGYAFRICRFVMAYILSNGKTPTIRTEEDNLPMQRVIEKLGFTIMKSSNVQW